MADEPNSGDKINVDQLLKPYQERISKLESKNSGLQDSLNKLESEFNKMLDTLKATPAKTPTETKKTLFDELDEFFKW